MTARQPSYNLATSVARPALESLGERIERQRRRKAAHQNLRVIAAALGLTALLLGTLLAGWVAADGPARLMHDYHAACAAGADCGDGQ